jgi:2'-5' RNA ligase
MILGVHAYNPSVRQSVQIIHISRTRGGSYALVMSELTDSAVVVNVPAAEPVVGSYRARLDAAASWGVPAHVTVLYPFLSPSEIDDDVLAALGRAVRTVPRFRAVWSRTAWFDQRVLWVAPEPAAAFQALTAAVVREFPEYLPFGGQYDVVVPHLTVGNDVPLADLLDAEREISPRLPFSMPVTHVQVLAGTQVVGSWRTLAELPLGR